MVRRTLDGIGYCLILSLVFWKKGDLVDMEELDRLQHVMLILDGTRDIMMLLESSTVKEIPVSVCIVFETAMEKAVTLLAGVSGDMEEGLAGQEGE